MNKTELAKIKADAIEQLTHGGYDLTRLTITTDYIGNVGTADCRVFVVLDGKIANITWLVARAIGDKPRERVSDGRWVIRTKGYGYSRAQHVADSLSWALHGHAGAIQYTDI